MREFPVRQRVAALQKRPYACTVNGETPTTCFGRAAKLIDIAFICEERIPREASAHAWAVFRAAPIQEQTVYQSQRSFSADLTYRRHDRSLASFVL
jgi:hypothetical protein